MKGNSPSPAPTRGFKTLAELAAGNISFSANINYSHKIEGLQPGGLCFSVF